MYTDTWVSMGDEAEYEKRLAEFQGFQIDAALMAKANDGALFMHDMPAYRGQGGRVGCPSWGFRRWKRLIDVAAVVVLVLDVLILALLA